MALSNDSITVTPGSGATVATQLVSSKEYQAVVVADQSGHLNATKPTWIAAANFTANVAAARTTHIDLFNASGSGVVLRIVGIYILPALAAVTGVGLTWELIRTSAVGTGGSTVTPNSFDTGNAALPGQVTCRQKPTGGATTSATLQYIAGTSEETIPYASMASILNHVPTERRPEAQNYVLREGEGIKIDQVTNSSVGTTAINIVFTVE